MSKSTKIKAKKTTPAILTDDGEPLPQTWAKDYAEPEDESETDKEISAFEIKDAYVDAYNCLILPEAPQNMEPEQSRDFEALKVNYPRAVPILFRSWLPDASKRTLCTATCLTCKECRDEILACKDTTCPNWPTKAKASELPLNPEKPYIKGIRAWGPGY